MYLRRASASHWAHHRKRLKTLSTRLDRSSFAGRRLRPGAHAAMVPASRLARRQRPSKVCPSGHLIRNESSWRRKVYSTGQITLCNARRAVAPTPHRSYRSTGPRLWLLVRGVAFGRLIRIDGCAEMAARDEMTGGCGCVSRNQVRDPSRSMATRGSTTGRGLCARMDIGSRQPHTRVASCWILSHGDMRRRSYGTLGVRPLDLSV
jgi:hypothetical protein